MKFFKSRSLSIVLLLLTSSCSDLLGPELSEEESRIIADCKAATINDKSSLENNLIGKWESIAYSCSGCSEQYDGEKFPDLTLELFADKTGVNSFNGDKSDVTWEVVEEISSGSESELMLKLNPGDNFYNRIMTFCQEYMINDSGTGVVIFRKN